MKIGQIRQWGTRNFVGENQGITERIYACIWSVGKQEEERGHFIVSPESTQCQNSDLHSTI